ncbi:MAG: SAM-dependent methyltransferase, partial [Achromobacter sp.]
MPAPQTDTIDIYHHNRTAWDRQAAQQCAWSQPVSAETIQAARRGDWQVHLTPRALPADWLPAMNPAPRILCLA